MLAVLTEVWREEDRVRDAVHARDGQAGGGSGALAGPLPPSSHACLRRTCRWRRTLGEASSETGRRRRRRRKKGASTAGTESMGGDLRI